MKNKLLWNYVSCTVFGLMGLEYSFAFQSTKDNINKGEMLNVTNQNCIQEAENVSNISSDIKVDDNSAEQSNSKKLFPGRFYRNHDFDLMKKLHEAENKKKDVSKESSNSSDT
jgi:hypothetical protein